MEHIVDVFLGDDHDAKKDHEDCGKPYTSVFKNDFDLTFVVDFKLFGFFNDDGDGAKFKAFASGRLVVG